VVFICYEDAKAYAAWAGKRLPTEAEWQYAAQTGDGRLWPWGNTVKQKGNQSKSISTTLTLVDYGIPDAAFCNTGDGKLYPVGKYKKGVNPFGLYDMVGAVWQMTNDWYQSDTYEYIMLKGGSYFQPGGSWWFVQGGPKPLPYRQMWLRVSQGFERNGTVGFRCVKDAE
jgi:formylglycine-generating enzyme required for sulfatase activity